MIVEATDEHIQEAMEGNTEGDMASLSELAKGQGFVWALVKGGKTLAVGGIRELWARTGEVWMLGTANAHSVPVELTRALRGVLRRADEAGFIRIQAVVTVDFIESQLWLERYGFCLEAMLSKYINGENYFMYARLNNG